MIYKKLLEFQKQGITIKKGTSNSFYKSTYANLNEVLDKVTKPLNDLGVVIIQTVQPDGLRTILVDTEDDTMIESTIEFVQKADAQKLGSNITYNRRYALVTMLSLEDEDDDGNKASDKEKSVTPATNNDDLDL
jgi:precorrin-6B methylase 2